MTTPPDLTVTSGDAGLQIVGLRKSYKRRPVIRDVSMHLNRGEVVALLGPNGSGKTTCFYAIAGLVSPEGGQVVIDGRDVTQLPMYRRARLGIGYLPQEVSIFRGLSVEDNILAVLEIVIGDRCRNFPSPTCAALLPWPFRVASVGGLKSRVVWPPIRNICCSMSPLPGLTRSRWERFAISLAT